MRQSLGDLVHLDLDTNGLVPGNLLAFCFQRFRQSQVVKDRGMKSIRESMHIFAQANQLAVHG